MKPKVILFDLDDTLTESKQAVTPEMAALFTKLLATRPLAIVSGAQRAQLLEQFVSHLPVSVHLENLFLFPQNAAEGLFCESTSWKELYSHQLSDEEVHRISLCLLTTINDLDVLERHAPVYGERIENRGAQVTFSACGQQAPIDIKRTWDPNQEKRKHIVSHLAPQLPEYQIGIGGSTSIDITKQGVDKRLSVTWLAERFSIHPQEMLYVGDGLFPGGNDTVVIGTGVQTQLVHNPAETSTLIETILKNEEL